MAVGVFRGWSPALTRSYSERRGRRWEAKRVVGRKEQKRTAASGGAALPNAFPFSLISSFLLLLLALRMAFIGAGLPIPSRPQRAPAAVRCGTAPPSTPTPSPPPPATFPRRVLLATVAALAASAATAVALPGPASADRTGKYSTKLTAARRYKPRISAAVASLSALGPILGSSGSSSSSDDAAWRDAVRTYVAGADSGLSAAKLFGSTYFAEGNRISATEKALAEEVREVEAAVARLGTAATSGSRSDAVAAWRAAARAFNAYLTAAKLDETPQIELGEE